jgi:type IV pilus assembly protein PilY1
MSWGDFVYLGSGDREHPAETSVVNRFYALRNTWPSGWQADDQVLFESDLFDASIDILGDDTATEAQKSVARQSLEAADGWWFNLPFSGEKCVSSAIVYDGSVYFTTFTPTAAVVAGEDKCATGAGAGVARLYRVDYRSGAAVKDLDGDGDKDRSVVLGSGIPSQPVAVAAEERMLLVIASEKKVVTHDLSSGQTLIPYYWIQI